MRDTALHYPNILFSLDGTLTDPHEDITRSVQFTLARLGTDEPDLACLEYSIGPPLLQCFIQTYGFGGARAWETVNHYREHFRVAGLYENRTFDGIPGLLEAPVGRSHTLYVATSKPGVFAREIARHSAFDRHFKAIYGSGLDGTRTHKDELIHRLLDNKGLAAEHCPMTDDCMHNLLNTSRNGVACIGVGCGFGNEGELRAHQPTHYYAGLVALQQVLESHRPILRFR